MHALCQSQRMWKGTNGDSPTTPKTGLQISVIFMPDGFYKINIAIEEKKRPSNDTCDKSSIRIYRQLLTLCIVHLFHP